MILIYVITHKLKFWYFTKLDSGCSPDGTDYMDVNGNCHCNQGFIGDECEEFCPAGEFGIPPNCNGNILFNLKQSKRWQEFF